MERTGWIIGPDRFKPGPNPHQRKDRVIGFGTLIPKSIHSSLRETKIRTTMAYLEIPRTRVGEGGGQKVVSRWR